MAAAAALFRSSGAAGARTTGGLFFIFTLLSLLCLAHSHLDKNELEQLKENTRKLEKDLAFQKDEMETSSELIDSYANLMVPLSELMKKTTSSLPDGFPPLDEMMQMLKDFIQKTKVYIDDKKEDMAEAIEIKEEKLRKMKMLIQILEEQQAEL